MFIDHAPCDVPLETVWITTRRKITREYSNIWDWTKPKHQLSNVRKENTSAFSILMSGWDVRCFIIALLFITSSSGALIVKVFAALFSAPSHIWGHTLTVMACSSLSRTNSSVCSDRKVFIRITSDIPLPSARRLLSLFETRVVKMFWSWSCCGVRLPDGALMNNCNGCAPPPAPPLPPSSSVYPPRPRKKKKNP